MSGKIWCINKIWEYLNEKGDETGIDERRVDGYSRVKNLEHDHKSVIKKAVSLSICARKKLRSWYIIDFS